ncbi:outer membrane protein assembly factor BamA [Desulfovibrio sp. OttesenSCG-928-G11]|nr:outer membrane protein assembly factor BamA [Desulfovibrio sp. OttesenSCG-928-G11]
MSRRADKVGGFLQTLALAALCVFFLVPCAFAASRGEARVLVLPFNFHSEQEQGALEDQFPEMLGRRLGAQGLEVVPHERMLNMVRSGKVTTLDVAAVRSLAQAAGASHAVYGSVNQAGNALSIDARLVSASAQVQPKPLFVEQGLGTANLGYAMDELAGAVAAEMPKAAAAPVVPQGSGNELAGVEVRGTHVLDPDVVLMRLTTRRGDKPDPMTIDQEIKRIWDLGYFSDVQANLEPRRDGLYLVYTVTEKPRLESVSVEGNKELDDEDIFSVMSSKSGSILNESLLAEDIQKILEAYRKKGFYLATVEQSVDMRQSGTAASLLIRINEGKQLYIEQVRLEGVSQLDEGDVKDQMLMTERNFLSWITGTGVLKEELIERDSSAISSYYLDRGFMDITVAAARVDYSEEGITVTFPIHEGPRYTLGDIRFSGDLIDTDETLRSRIQLDKMAAAGEPFNLSALQADSKSLTDFYADYGYAFADVDARPMKRADGSLIADIDFNIVKKNKVYVRRVLVEGNSKTRDNVILREMRLTDGEQFDGAKLRRSTERLNKLGYFEVAEAELIHTGDQEEVDLKVKVKEKPTGALMAGVGYSTFSQVGVAGTIMERNLWGKGYQVSLQAAFSGLRDAYTLSFNNPRFNDTYLAVGGDAYHWRDDYLDYVKRTNGGVLRFSYPIGEYSSIGWGYRLEQYEIYDLNWNAAKIIQDYADETRYTSVILGRIVRDSTNREHPTSGNIDSLNVEYGGGLAGGDDDFINVTVEHQTYFELRPDHVLHARIKGAVLLENGSDTVPVFERYWMGGMNSVRGYNSRDIVPRDPATNDRIGGTRMGFMNLEYIYTLNHEFGLYLVPFYDMGFNLDADHDYSFNDELLKSAGLELRWRSPMGDLRFSYGVPFDEDRKGDRGSGRFEFSMGQIF